MLTASARIERLEQRRHLSVSTTLLGSGVLIVSGTKQADEINVQIAPLGHVTISSGGAQIYSSDTNQDSISGISIIGGNEDDTITVGNNESGFAVTVNGNKGNDTITANATRAPGARIDAGAGNDHVDVANAIGSGINDGSVINAGDGDDRVNCSNALGSDGSTIHGGAGTDGIQVRSLSGATEGHIVYGDDGIDSIHGGDLRDYLLGGAGNDRLMGGNGDDILIGNDGKDWLYGQAGDDLLEGGTGVDTIDGNIGIDTLIGDGKDLVKAVELIL